MASFWNIASRFGRQTSKPTTPTSPSPAVPQSPASPAFPSTPRLPSPTTPKAAQAQDFAQSNTQSSSESNNMTNEASSEAYPPQPQTQLQPAQPQLARPLYFFREENSGIVVKGNFMTLAAKPEHVEQVEWLAHQVVEQHRVLSNMITVVQEIDSRTNRPICNPDTCPTMNAAEYTYTWLDNFRKPIRIPAAQYINLVQKWIRSKIDDPRIFPNDPDVFSAANRAPQTGAASSRREWSGKNAGFPESFQHDIKGLYRQMFRCYAHLYHGHWLEPFYHLSAQKELNTAFVHFVNVGRIFDLLEENDLKPMKPLIDIWVAKGIIGGPKQQVQATQQTQAVNAVPAAAASTPA